MAVVGLVSRRPVRPTAVLFTKYCLCLCYCVEHAPFKGDCAKVASPRQDGFLAFFLPLPLPPPLLFSLSCVSVCLLSPSEGLCPVRACLHPSCGSLCPCRGGLSSRTPRSQCFGRSIRSPAWVGFTPALVSRVVRNHKTTGAKRVPRVQTNPSTSHVRQETQLRKPPFGEQLLSFGVLPHNTCEVREAIRPSTNRKAGGAWRPQTRDCYAYCPTNIQVLLVVMSQTHHPTLSTVAACPRSCTSYVPVAMNPVCLGVSVQRSIGCRSRLQCAENVFLWLVPPRRSAAQHCLLRRLSVLPKKKLSRLGEKVEDGLPFCGGTLVDLCPCLGRFLERLLLLPVQLSFAERSTRERWWVRQRIATSSKP